MSMLGKLKQFKDLRKQAKEIQSQLQSISETGSAESGKVTVTVDGSQTIKDVMISEELLTPTNKTRVQEAIKSAHADGIKKIQKIMAEKMRKGELEMPDLSAMQ